MTRDNHHVLRWPNAGIELPRMALSNKEQEKRIVVAGNWRQIWFGPVVPNS
jgi:hypothetical protein